DRETRSPTHAPRGPNPATRADRRRGSTGAREGGFRRHGGSEPRVEGGRRAQRRREGRGTGSPRVAEIERYRSGRGCRRGQGSRRSGGGERAAVSSLELARYHSPDGGVPAWRRAGRSPGPGDSDDPPQPGRRRHRGGRAGARFLNGNPGVSATSGRGARKRTPPRAHRSFARALYGQTAGG